MGERLAKLLLLTIPLGGCSLIYGPDRLPAVNDAPPDSPAPVDCTLLKLDRVFPPVLFEGQGDDGGRSAVLLIEGTNIAPNATVEIVPHAGETNVPLLALDRASLAVDSWGLRMAVPVKLHVDANIGAAKSIRLDVRVSQPCEATGSMTMFSLEALEEDAPVLKLQGLDELTGTANLPTASPHLFSRVDVATINAMDVAKPLIVRSTSSIKITGAGPHDFNAAGGTPGPGGGPGGAGGAALGGPGGPGGGTGGGKTAGGGGGFATRGMDGTKVNTGGDLAGEASLAGWDRPNRGCGGAGGDGAGLGGGSVGGGGGGVLELTAAGDLTITGTIEAKGANGLGSGDTAGGGGSGGAILLRAGGSNISVENVVATGGTGPKTGAAGDGAPGRVRFDSPSKTATFTATPAIGYRGPMFVAAPMVVREEQPRLTIVGPPGELIKYTIENAEGATLGPIEINMPPTGETSISLAMPLFEGYNRLCALVTGVTSRRDEAENCVTLAYLFQRR
jgi:hypothetical protein